MSDEKPQIGPWRAPAEDLQLSSIKTPFTNSTLRGPAEDIGDLECELTVYTSEVTGESICTDSAWEPDEHQRDLLAAGAHIRLGVWQHPIPPLMVSLEAPFCDTCETSMVYVKAEGAFFCAGACPKRDPRFGPPAATNGSAQPEDHDDEDERAAGRRALDDAHRDFTPGGDIPADEEPRGPTD
jgi:hypothetical protein